MSKSPSPGRSRPVYAARVGAGVSVLALVVAGCASSGHPSAAARHAKSPMPEMSSSMPMASPSMSMGMVPMGAKHMHVAIVSPAAGTKVTGNSVTVHVRVSGYKDTCALAGKHVMGMEATTTGHYHVLLDGAL